MEERGETSRADRHALERKLKIIDEQKDRLMQLFGEEGIELDRLKKSLSELDRQTDILEKQREAMAKDKSKTLAEICEAIDALRDRPAEYLRASLEDKADILRAMAETVTLSEDGDNILWKAPYSFLMKPAVLSLRESRPSAYVKTDAMSGHEKAPPSGEALSGAPEEFALVYYYGQW